MRVSRLELNNFRNYNHCSIDFRQAKTIIIGENAQGKSNLLEALELLSGMRSDRAASDLDLIKWGESAASLSLEYNNEGVDEQVSLSWAHAAKPSKARLQKTIKLNGLSQQSVKAILGRFLCVSFKSSDLNLLRGGPRFRRDWIDMLVLRLKPAFYEVSANFAKVVAQRNKLLKIIAEKGGRLSVSDQDQLLVWDKQTAVYGSKIIKQRLAILEQLMPIAQAHQKHLSRGQESLQMTYQFRTKERTQDNDEFSDDYENPAEAGQPSLNPSTESEEGLARYIFNSLKERRFEELRRKQTLIGPHRDDLLFSLNGADAINFASQGQQRSLVLALKMAELEILAQSLDVSPVLLLDDVLAELDEARQGSLLAKVGEKMQTIVTTTHVSGFDERWLADAQILKVKSGLVGEEGNYQALSNSH